MVRRGLRLAAGGRHLHLSLSADSIASADLPPVIERELREARADPPNVVFELAETALMNDPVNLVKGLAQGLRLGRPEPMAR